jgi:ATP-dependent helicase/nuclease subunit B
MPARARVISSTRNLVEEVLDALDLAPDDLRQTMVVFPGKRPGHFLRKAIARRKGTSYIPPLALSYEGFIDYLAEQLHLTQKPLQPLDAAAILFRIHQEEPEKLGDQHFGSFDRFIGLGLKLYEEFEEIHRADLPAQRIDESIGGLTFARLHTLRSYYTRFYTYVEQNGLATPALRLRRVAQEITNCDLSRFQNIVLAGFYALTNTDVRIFNELARNDRVLMLFQQGPGLQRQLEKLNIALEEQSEGQAGTPSIVFSSSPDAHGQILALSHVVKSLLEQQEPLDERTAIVVPSADALVPLLHHVLTLLPEEGYNISLGYPLERTPLYGFVSNLMSVVASADGDRFLASSYVKFILHPYTKNIRLGVRTDVTRALVHAIEEWLAYRSSTMVTLEEIERSEIVFDRAVRLLDQTESMNTLQHLRDHLRMIHDATIRKFLQISSLRAFATSVMDVILFVDEHSTANFHPLFHRYAEAFLEMMDEVRHCAAAEESFSELVGYASFLRSYVATHTVPFPGTPLQGVQVLGMLETRNLSFDRVLMLDVSDDVIPGSRGSEMIVPQGLREKLGLETYRDREKLMEYYVHLLIEGAKEVYLFFTENDKKEPSRLIQKMVWQKEMRERKREPFRKIRYALHLAHRPPEAIVKDSQILSYLKQFKYSATALDTYLICPLRFYYRYVLELKEKEEVSEGIDPLDVGNLVHRSLAEFFKPLVGRNLKKEDLDAQKLEKTVEEVFSKSYGEKVKGSAYLVKRQVTEQLKAFLQGYQAPLLEKGPTQILGVEQVMSVIKDEFTFSGRIDCIERRNNVTFVIDYKISADDRRYKIRWKKFDPDNRETWPDSIGSIQLPMYALLYSRLESVDPATVVPLYLLLGKSPIDEKIEASLEQDDASRAAAYQAMEKVIMGLVREINDPSVPFHPTEDQKSNCPECPYQTLCGTLWAKKGRW